MTEMVERAAKAACESALTESAREERYRDRDALLRTAYVPIARATLLAALDPEDEALVEAVARAMYEHTRTDPRFTARPAWEDNDSARDYWPWFARAAIAKLKRMAQGGRLPE